MLGSVAYDKIDDEGLHITIGKKEKEILRVDNVIICAGQTPRAELLEELRGKGVAVHLIGGAEEARELDAKRAIDRGARLAAEI